MTPNIHSIGRAGKKFRVKRLNTAWGLYFIAITVLYPFLWFYGVVFMGARKIRSDSTEAKVLANKAAQTKLEPPQN
ncbi:hypothetical protein [Aggregatibacter aphrophilus]|uniref:hypothetical protein n=1 Tax=Aggregatibacter aphrophilus TaxID=732 RepID=UPI000FD71683|nr:hypothetical protein [Aggregatibacter aphrophilus]